MFPQVPVFFVGNFGQPPMKTIWKPPIVKRPSTLGPPPPQPLETPLPTKPTVKETTQTADAKTHDDNEKREKSIISSMEVSKLIDVPRRSFMGHNHFFKYKARSSNSQTSFATEEDIYTLRKKATALRYRLAKMRLDRNRDDRVISNLLDFLTSSKDGKQLGEDLRREGRIVC